ncbi:MAG: hypothetical protein WCE81_00675 [Halobacteriota archaeon]
MTNYVTHSFSTLVYRIGRPFQEINWRKVDEYRAKGLSWSAVSRVMDIPLNTLLAAKARREEKEN